MEQQATIPQNWRGWQVTEGVQKFLKSEDMRYGRISCVLTEGFQASQQPVPMLLPGTGFYPPHLAEDSDQVPAICDTASIRPGAGGSLEAHPLSSILGPHLHSLNVTFMGSFCESLSGQDRAARSVPLEYLLSASMARTTEEIRQMNSSALTWLCPHRAQQVWHCLAGTRQPDDPKLGASLWQQVCYWMGHS